MDILEKIDSLNEIDVMRNIKIPKEYTTILSMVSMLSNIYGIMGKDILRLERELNTKKIKTTVDEWIKILNEYKESI